MFERARGGMAAGRTMGMTSNTVEETIADIAITAYFFAMRSCEITTTPQRGRTKILRIRGIAFRNDKGEELAWWDYNAIKLATRVTVTFEDQKNGLKMDKRTHQRTGDPVMCPIRSLSSIARRIRESIPGAGGETQLNTVWEHGKETYITGERLRDSLRSTCTEMGGSDVFGFDGKDIGTKSLRSGAAMGLFLMNHSVAKIMILGRWSSDAFLVYIRPQVMEWTNQMSADMIAHDSFLDTTERRQTRNSGGKGPAKIKARSGVTRKGGQDGGMYVEP